MLSFGASSFYFFRHESQISAVRLARTRLLMIFEGCTGLSADALQCDLYDFAWVDAVVLSTCSGAWCTEKHTLHIVSPCRWMLIPGNRAQQRTRGTDGHPRPDDARGSQQPPLHHQRFGTKRQNLLSFKMSQGSRRKKLLCYTFFFTLPCMVQSFPTPRTRLVCTMTTLYVLRVPSPNLATPVSDASSFVITAEPAVRVQPLKRCSLEMSDASLCRREKGAELLESWCRCVLLVFSKQIRRIAIQGSKWLYKVAVFQGDVCSNMRFAAG